MTTPARLTPFAATAAGATLCLVVATGAWLLGRQLPLIGGAVFAITIGMLVRLLWTPPPVFTPGIKFTSKKVLQAAIVLLGFEMNIVQVLETGAHSLVVMLFSLAAAFVTAFYAGKALGVASRPKTLVGIGTAICGGSAIAATAPVIRADDEEVAQSISTIFLFNIIAVFVFPALGRLLQLSDEGFGLWAGTAINDTSSVVAAASTWSTTALQLATIVKLTRTLMIVPITLVLAVSAARSRSDSESRVAIGKIFPYFVLGFLTASLIATSGFLPGNLDHTLTEIGKFLIVAAMSAIGLSTNVVSLLRNGLRPILLGLACWAAVALSTLGVMRILGSW